MIYNSKKSEFNASLQLEYEIYDLLWRVWNQKKKKSEFNASLQLESETNDLLWRVWNL